VAAEAQRLEIYDLRLAIYDWKNEVRSLSANHHSSIANRQLKWRSHVDLHHELPPSQSGVQN
jgi:hypothetical protein